MAITIERVSPGELIRASDYNDIARTLEILDARITALESKGGGGSGPVITDIKPDEPVERGLMEILGHRFAVPAILNTLTLDGVGVTDILPGSDDELLRATVPPGFTGLPRDLTLKLETAAGSTTRTVRIRPEAVTPEGRPTIANITTGVGAIEHGKTYTFLFRIDATDVSIEEEYHLRAVYSDVVDSSEAKWKEATKLVGTAAGDMVSVKPTDPMSVGVSVTIPEDATSVALTLRAESVNNDPDSSGSSLKIPIVVGEDLPESQFPMRLLEVGARMRVIDDNGVEVLQIEYPAAGASRTVQVPVNAGEFPVAGTYDYEAELADPGTLWSLGAVTPASTIEGAGDTQKINVALTLKATGPSSERRNLTVTAKRRETTGPGRISGFAVVPVEGFTP
jgi:hypothetical protein